MMTFFAYTTLFMLATACFIKILHISIQPGQWLDKLLNWQNRLLKWDMEGKEFLAKAGGLCEVCFSHILSFISFWAYLFIMTQGFDMWVAGDNLITSTIINILWYLTYISTCTVSGLYFITKLFEK